MKGIVIQQLVIQWDEEDNEWYTNIKDVREYHGLDIEETNHGKYYFEKYNNYEDYQKEECVKSERGVI